MKLSKQQIKQHESAAKLLEKDHLTYDEKVQVYRDWIPAYSENIGVIASYFTPHDMAGDMCIEVNGLTVVDLCAGIGMLAFTYYHWVKCGGQHTPKITCIERNPAFVEVGKKLLPEANWICADVLDESVYKFLPEFDCAISNPPFGKIKSTTNSSWLSYKGNEFEYKVIEIGSRIAHSGVYIIPQMSCSFQYSGREYSGGIKYDKSPKYKKFNKETGIEIDMNCGIDLSIYKDDWVGTSIVCEIACVNDTLIKPIEVVPELTKDPTQPYPQLTLF